MPRRTLAALRIPLALALTLALTAPAPAQDDSRALWRESLAMTAEYELAQKPALYYLLDLEGRKIAVKARGMALKEFPIVEEGVWGRPLQIGKFVVEEKDALAQPARPAITPGQEKSIEQLDESILELNDMPTTYRLSLEGDVNIEVLPAVDQLRPRIRQRVHLWSWWLMRPILTLKERRARRESTWIYLVLRPQDAQSLYWSFYEGLEGVVLPPPPK